MLGDFLRVSSQPMHPWNEIGVSSLTGWSRTRILRFLSGANPSALKMAGSAVEYGTRFSRASLRICGLGLAMKPTSWIQGQNRVIIRQTSQGNSSPLPTLSAFLARVTSNCLCDENGVAKVSVRIGYVMEGQRPRIVRCKFGYPEPLLVGESCGVVKGVLSWQSHVPAGESGPFSDTQGHTCVYSRSRCLLYLSRFPVAFRGIVESPVWGAIWL